MFFHMEKMILRRQMTKTSKGFNGQWHFLSSVPSPAKPTHSSCRGDGRLGDCCRQPPPGAGLRAPGVAASKATGTATHRPSPRMGATLFPPGSSRKANANAVAVLHTHTHIPKPRKLWSSPPGTWAATLLELSRRPPPETDLHPRWASPIAALENQLSNLTLHLQLERPA